MTFFHLRETSRRGPLFTNNSSLFFQMSEKEGSMEANKNRDNVVPSIGGFSRSD
jgi:hypothetical protein